MDKLTIEHIGKTYEGMDLLTDCSLEVQSGELLCLLGRSGSGKSTLLRIIAGIEPADRGRILWNGEDLSNVPTHRRGFGLMFQDFALFPHLNVAENVAFGLNLQKHPADEVKARVDEVLAQVNMQAFALRRVTDLSGGEQQRVALARSLAPHPKLLMLDEPLGALDRALRGQLQEELREQLHRTGIPAIYVTHDQDEALALSDRIALLHDGRIEQAGNASDVYAQPANLWVADFLGMSNLLPGQVAGTWPFSIQTQQGLFTPEKQGSSPTGSRGTLLVKPFWVELTEEEHGESILSGKVLSCVFQVDHYQLKVQVAPDLDFNFSVQTPLEEGAMVTLKVKPEALLWFEEAR